MKVDTYRLARGNEPEKLVFQAVECEVSGGEVVPSNGAFVQRSGKIVFRGVHPAAPFERNTVYELRSTDGDVERRFEVSNLGDPYSFEGADLHLKIK